MMTSPDATPGRPATAATRKRQGRARDIGVIVIAAAVVLAMLAISGQVNWPAALIGVVALSTLR